MGEITEEMTCESGNHRYSIRYCEKCGEVFCWNCCMSTNVHMGGNYEKEYMLCPKCGHNILED
jgi:hypothetical protein